MNTVQVSSSNFKKGENSWSLSESLDYSGKDQQNKTNKNRFDHPFLDIINICVFEHPFVGSFNLTDPSQVCKKQAISNDDKN